MQEYNFAFFLLDKLSSLPVCLSAYLPAKARPGFCVCRPVYLDKALLYSYKWLPSRYIAYIYLPEIH